MNSMIKTAPPWPGSGKKIESLMRKALFDHEMIEEKKIAVALSGGKDSLTLLAMLKAVSGRGFPPFELIAIHVGGDFTCGAGVGTAYIENFCKLLDVPIIFRESTQKLETLECYSCSRERRRLLFEAAKSEGSTTIAFGHHRDDNVQTAMMNLLSKGEFAGNLPKLKMVDYGCTIIRPLILVAEHEIKEFAKQCGFLRIMCGCPVGQNSMRREVEKLVQNIETVYPHARENIARGVNLYGSHKAKRMAT